MKLCYLVIPIIYCMARCFSWLFKYFFSLLNNFKVWESLQGKYVVVTYATSELGEAICARIVEKGMKLLLLGNNEQDLIHLRARLLKKTKIIYHVVDFSIASDFSFLDKYDIGLIINLLIVPDPKPQYFINQKVASTIDSLLRGQFQMLKAVLALMAQKHKGYVLNVNFSFSLQPRPQTAFVSALMSFYKLWSESMYYEMMPSNVNVEFMDVGPVDSSNARFSLFNPSVETLSKCIVGTLGTAFFTIPYFPHLIEFSMIFTLPGFLVARYRSAKNEALIRNYHNLS